ncbi:MAG: sugar ABC transporter ATP-binding protein [Clostridia bacterium]|nr:sugar ABC transporter ATP-binding protein [Clostridia bacterium]
MRGITKTFPGVKALDNVNLQVEDGEIHALVGENGAGKSTLMKVLSGIHPYGTYEGDILYEGEECRFQEIRDSENKGIVIIHQELALVPYLTIAENMFLGNEQRKMKGVIDWDATYANAVKYMRIVGLEDSPRELIKNIGTGKQQLVEIAKALAKNVKLLILDEPTSSLTEADSKNLLDLLLVLKETRHITSIIISHKLNEIAYVADHITVIRDGKTIETLDKKTDDFSEARIIKGMVGREMTNRFPRRENVKIGPVSFEIKDWTVHHPLYPERKVVDNVSIYLRKGEVVGIAGLIGAGRTELCQSVFGRAYGTHISGQLFKDGKEIRLNSVADAVEAGLAYVTEDRKGDGLVLSNSIKHNITLSRLGLVSEHGVMNADQEYAKAQEYREKLSIKTPTVEQLVNNLSGGNQQKVLVAKWMYAQPDIMMLDEPTRGIDVGAKYEIYCIINDMAAEGKTVLMVSSELPELLGMCDRIYVMCEGRLIGELPVEQANQEVIMQMIMEESKTSIGSAAKDDSEQGKGK